MCPLLLTPAQQGDPLPLQASPLPAGGLPLPCPAVQSWSEGLGPPGEWGPDPLRQETPSPRCPKLPWEAKHQEGSFTKGLKPETVTSLSEMSVYPSIVFAPVLKRHLFILSI